MSTVLLEGGNVRPEGNKGDELMLYTVLSRLRQHDSSIKISCTPDRGEYRLRAQLGLYQALWPRNLKRLSGSLGFYVLERYRKSFGIVTEQEVDCVINFQGYRFADIGERQTIMDAANAVRRRKNGTRLVFLPQAYGPFTTPRIRSAAKRLFQNADLISARDERSADHLRMLSIEEEKIVICPDITIDYHSVNSGDSVNSDHVYIIPNIWMVERTADKISESYLGFLKKSFDIIGGYGYRVSIINHAPFQDTTLVKSIACLLGDSVEVVDEFDARKIKDMIGNSAFIIGSRYHSLVAALSQNVPAIGTSWSHKYDGLFTDYECNDLLLNPGCSDVMIRERLHRLLNVDERAGISEVLRRRNMVIRERLQVLWNRVYSVLNSSRNVSPSK